SGWMFRDTYPVKWAVSDLDANQDTIVIDSMELAYKQYISIRI
ncbi:MAG: phage tail protein, partial [Sinomicrobium sp.]|nr:phage tail protein [Sinomicrobium sp.]